MNTEKTTPQKIAILGGGLGSITAAFELTSQEGWREKYDITVYQLGWRIGGKGASGRNPQYGSRIQEHGLHIFFGFYENTFRVMRACYEELGRSPDQPLNTWQEAFKPHSFILLEQYVNGKWYLWPVTFPTNNQLPGDRGPEAATPWRLLYTLLEFLLQHFKNSSFHKNLSENSSPNRSEHPRWEKLEGEIKNALETIEDGVKSALGIVDDLVGLELLEKAVEITQRLEQKEIETGHDVIAILLKGFIDWLEKEIGDLASNHIDDYRLYLVMDLGVAILRGMINDDVIHKGYDVINKYDFREWLAKHGASELSVNSAPARCMYDLAFAYEGGDIHKPNFEAGTYLRSAMRIFFDYKGAIMWKMQAAMGDTIFTPFYQVLKRRGVKFEFFHEVNELQLGEDGKSIEKIIMTQQVALKDPEKGYDPLVEVKGLECWPSVPNYDQIDPKQAELLKNHDINLESFWTDWPEVYEKAFGQPLPQKTLSTTNGGFDLVILGISIASLPYICRQLISASPQFNAMVENIKTVQTQAYQVWMKETVEGLGWKEIELNQEPVLTCFGDRNKSDEQELDTWADMSDLIIREAWPDPWPNSENKGLYPKNVSYFCGPFADASPELPPRSDHKFPTEEYNKVKRAAIDMLKTRMWNLWPKATQPNSKEFNWDLLVDPDKAQGQERFNSQFWRANIDPSERYVLSVVNSSQSRLPTDGSGFANLYLTGDWIRTGLNVGCAEAAVMSGMQASRTICGYPKDIAGEQDLR